MPAVARANGTDSVLSPDGTGYKCRSPMTTATAAPNQSKVRAQGVFIVVQGAPVAPHPLSGCGPDQSTLSSFSSKVRAGGRGVGRIGDAYGNNTITSGSTKVMAA